MGNFSQREELSIDECYNRDESSKLSEKKPDQSHILYDPIYMRYLEESNTQSQTVIQWLPGAGVGETGGSESRDGCTTLRTS